MECVPKESKTVIIEFGENTTAHGVPRITKARTRRGSLFWIVVTLSCLIVFTMQAILLMQRYFRFETTTQIQLKFEAVPFPAVTVCNLNPFKKSRLCYNPHTCAAWSIYVTHMRDEGITDFEENFKPRSKRQVSDDATSTGYIQQSFKPVYSSCHCEDEYDECMPTYEPPKPGQKSVCICFYETNNMQPWPCFANSTWFQAWCKNNCTDSGRCTRVHLPKPYTAEDDRIYANITACACQKRNSFCLRTDDQPYAELWKLPRPTTTPLPATTVTSTTTEKPTTTNPAKLNFQKTELQEAGQSGTKSKRQQENSEFAASGSTVDERRNMSHSQGDFIRSCTFSKSDCNMDKDFRVHDDPKYGSCFTFNFDRKYSETRKTGPLYGLRLVLFLDAVEYVPYVEDLGARISVHTNDTYPFLDVFGYNAPVGFTSSFGIRLKRVTRLPWPHGSCNSSAMPEDYLYKPYEYSTEANYRTTLQRILTKKCGCGDPLYPVYPGTRYCSVNSTFERKCLENQTKAFANEKQNDASSQPCMQTVYDTTFSAARWPTRTMTYKNLNITCEGTKDECFDYLRENVATIEVYFEQLNCEYLQEAESYPWVNLLSDIGGQLGLWLGFSIITLVEILTLFVDLLKICCRRKPKPAEEFRTTYNGDLYGTQSVEFTMKLRTASFS